MLANLIFFFSFSDCLLTSQKKNTLDQFGTKLADNTSIDCFLNGRERSIQFENKKVVKGQCSVVKSFFFAGLILFERLHERSMKYGVWNCSRQNGGDAVFLCAHPKVLRLYRPGGEL